MRAQLLHLSGPSRGRTKTFATPIVAIGSDPANAERLEAPAVAPHHATIEFRAEECAFHLTRADGATFVNGTEIDEVILQDGDRLEFGLGGPVARFRIYVPQGAVCKPVRRMLADAGHVARVSGHLAATQTLTRDLLTQATVTLKVGFPLFVIACALLVGWIGGWLGAQESLRGAGAEQVTQTELARLRAEQERHSAAIAQLVAANETVARIEREWSRGVCLLHGIYRVRKPDGSWLLARGVPFEVEYTGSGFLASPAGHIVTNRHVALPWLDAAEAALFAGQKGTPEFVRFTATFPGLAPLPVDAKLTLRRQDEFDVAVVRVAAADIAKVPVLPLGGEREAATDTTALVVGYPTGLSALLARADEGLVQRLIVANASMGDAIDALATAGQIQPLLTQGVISERRKESFTYDAMTTHGGSGGPVFGASGKVIAVNHAVLKNYTGASFGVPIRFAAELLPR